MAEERKRPLFDLQFFEATTTPQAVDIPGGPPRYTDGKTCARVTCSYLESPFNFQQLGDFRPGCGKNDVTTCARHKKIGRHSVDCASFQTN